MFFRNSWTAVSIDGSWCFINCNWGARHVKGKGRTEEGTTSRKKREGIRLDSNTHTHYNNVDILYEHNTPERSSGRNGERRDSLENRESSGVPQLNNEELYCGAAPTVNNGMCSAFSGGSVSGIGGHYGYGNFQGSIFPNENRMRTDQGGSSYNDSRSKLQGLSGNTDQFQNVGSGNYTSPYTVPNGYVVNPDPSGNRTHVVRKLPTEGGSNKENRVDDGVVSLDGYAGRSLLDAFYNKDIKSKSAVARLSDGDTASFSSGYSKSSTENMSPSNSPLASMSSTPRSGGAFGMHFDSSSSSSSQKEHERFSPPQSLFRTSRQQHDASASMRCSPPQAVFRNSSGSDNSARSSPPHSSFRPTTYSQVNPSKTSPPSSIFRFANAASTSVSSPQMTSGITTGHHHDEYLKHQDRLSPPRSDTERLVYHLFFFSNVLKLYNW